MYHYATELQHSLDTPCVFINFRRVLANRRMSCLVSNDLGELNFSKRVICKLYNLGGKTITDQYGVYGDLDIVGKANK